jgi:ATP-binding protein involved in chromosome partitioning
LNNMNVTNDAVLKALSKVQEPELHKDLVTLNMIHDLKVDGDKVGFTIMLTTPACPLKSQIEQEARKAVSEIPGVASVDIKLDAYVPSDGMSRGLLKLPIRNSIAIASGKGGVGKSTVAVNVAVVLAKSGARVGLLDADIYGPNVPRMMGVDHLPPARDDSLVPAEAFGVKLMSIGFLVKHGQPLIWRGPMLHSAIRQFLTDVSWGELDYLVVDLPPGTGDVALSLVQSLPLSGSILVTLPQQVSLDDARRALEMFRQLEVPVFGVVENMSYLELPDGTKMDVFGSGGGERLSMEAGVPFLGSIPMDPSVRVGGDAGVPVVISKPESAVSNALTRITQNIAARISISALEKTNFIPVNLA